MGRIYMMESFSHSRPLLLLKRRAGVILLVIVYVASAWIIATAALLLLDRPLSADRIRSQEERVDTATLDELKTFKRRQEERRQQLPEIRHDPFVGS